MSLIISNVLKVDAYVWKVKEAVQSKYNGGSNHIIAFGNIHISQKLTVFTFQLR